MGVGNGVTMGGKHATPHPPPPPIHTMGPNLAFEIVQNKCDDKNHCDAVLWVEKWMVEQTVERRKLTHCKYACHRWRELSGFCYRGPVVSSFYPQFPPHPMTLPPPNSTFSWTQLVAVRSHRFIDIWIFFIRKQNNISKLTGIDLRLVMHQRSSSFTGLSAPWPPLGRI